ncbi:MAG: (Fe-S)-binding protein [Candidatus Heimdallarchaeota archaeon]
MRSITESKRDIERKKFFGDTLDYLDKVYESNLRNLLKKCYQCGRCSSVCQLSKVQKFPPSRIIQLILEGFEDKVLNSGVLWDCLTCNQCLKDCPEKINFADIVRIARYKMRHEANQKSDDLIAHKGIYTTIAEIMSRPYITPERSLEWIPKDCSVSDKGDILYYVGCLPFYEYEFEGSNNIATSTIKLLCQIEKKSIVVLKEESCCGHDIYWGQGKLKTFIKLAKKNLDKFEKAGVSTIITACAECYRTLKIDYSNIFENFSSKFKVKHIIEYIYDKWKQNEIAFKGPVEEDKDTTFTYHDPCRLSRFLPEEVNLTKKIREIFNELMKLGFNFKEMKHNKENSLCCGVNSWMNCNEKSKALRYKRMLEAKSVATIMVTSCPKCELHFKCLQNDFEDIASIKILDFSEFIINNVEIIGT